MGYRIVKNLFNFIIAIVVFIGVGYSSGLMAAPVKRDNFLSGAYDSDDDHAGTYVKDQVIARPKSDSYTIPYGMKMKKMKHFFMCNKNKKKKNKKCTSPDVNFDIMTLQISDPTMTPGQAITALNQTGDYEYAEYDYMIKENAVPNDPLFSQQWGLESTHETNPDIDAPMAWDITTDSSDVVVAIIDTGIDYTHPDLVDNMWTNVLETPGDGIDNDLNGVIDDYYGFDAHNDDGDPMDDRGHGTHLAGIIGATGNNGVGVAGIGWNANIMAIKHLGDNGTGSISDAIEAIEYVISMRERGVNVKVTNNSWGGTTYSQGLSDAIGALADQDILFVASAGNDVDDLQQTPHYPSNYKQSNILVVGMHDSVNSKVATSNYGEAVVDISAPGQNILSTALDSGATVCQDTNSDGYSFCSGTSMSAAFVSGVAALLSDTHQNDTYQDLIDRIVRSSKPSIVTTRFAIPWTGQSATGEILDAHGALTYQGLTASPRKFLIEAERPFFFQTPIEIDELLTISSLSDSAKTWSLQSDVEWMSVDQPGGSAIPDQSSGIQLDIDYEFDFGVTTGHIMVDDLTELNDEFSIPVSVVTRLRALQLTENKVNSPVFIDEMGYAVDVEDDVAVISAPGEALDAEFGGSVYVFRRHSENNWVLEQTLTPDAPVAGYRFGSDVAISGNHIVVGSQGDDSATSNAGSAYVFKFDQGTWVQQQKLLPTNASQGDAFGEVVSIDNNLMAIGAPQVAITFAPGAELRRGAAYIYRLEADQWNLEAKLQQADVNEYTRFGSTVSISGSRVAVGAQFYPTESFNTSGRAYTFVYQDGAWSVENRFDPFEDFISSMGAAVALQNDELLIGAPDSSNDTPIRVGAALFYTFSNGAWNFNQRITPPDIKTEDVNFGLNLDFDQDRIVVGVSSKNIEAINSGEAFVYERVGNQWVPDGRITPTDAVEFQQLNFGRDVAVSGSNVVVGSGLITASRIDTAGYIYELPRPIPHLETMTVNNVDANWTTVNVQNKYQQMVPVCTLHYQNNAAPVVIRMQNVSANSFEIKLQNPGDLDQVFADTVYCMVAEEGVWTLPDGTKVEAAKVDSTITDSRQQGWNGETQTFGHSYGSDRPIIFGQVMSYNDPRWSVFWSVGSKRFLPINKSNISVGKHVAQDSDGDRLDEQLGYIIIEAGEGQVDSTSFETNLISRQIANLGSDNNVVDLSFSVLPAFAMTSQSGMRGTDGSWSILEGFDGLAQGQLRIALDEDQIADQERLHTAEYVGCFTATEHLNIPLTPIQ